MLFPFGQWVWGNSKISNLPPTKIRLLLSVGPAPIQSYVLVQKRDPLFSITERVKERSPASRSTVRRLPTETGIPKAFWLLALRISCWLYPISKEIPFKILSSWKQSQLRLSGVLQMIPPKRSLLASSEESKCQWLIPLPPKVSWSASKLPTVKLSFTSGMAKTIWSLDSKRASLLSYQWSKKLSDKKN